MAEFGGRFLSTLAVLLSASGHAAEPIPAASVVRFNTVCANCHEGECSGRLSFHTGAHEARGHMQRYLGNITDREAENLFGLLRYTKEQCAYYPLASPIKPDQALTASELSAWRKVQEGGFFIPLGALGKGEYQLRLDL